MGTFHTGALNRVKGYRDNEFKHGNMKYLRKSLQ